MSIIIALTAASLASAAPAVSEVSAATAFRAGNGPALTLHRDDRRDRDHRRRHRRGDVFLYYDRDYQGDSAWRPSSFNDWWHEKTERSYPRWMQNNAGCERQWFAGDTLRC